MKTRLLFFSFFILFISITHAQNWAKCITGTSTITQADIEVDASGNVYTTGYYSGSADFDPGTGTCTYSTSSWGCYISKLDASGNLAWAKSWGNANSMVLGQGIEADAEGNVYLSGYYESYNGDSIDLDPGLGTCYFRSINISFGKRYGCFIVKLNTSGNFVWAKHFDGFCYVSYPNAKTDIGLSENSSSLYFTTNFQGTVDFDPGAGTTTLTATSSSANDADVAVIKLDTAGNFVWAKNIGTYISEDIQVDADEHIYWMGVWSNMYISKLDSSGNIMWTNAIVHIGSNYEIDPFDMTIDAVGNVYTTGRFNGGTFDFDPGAGTYYMTPASVAASFITKWDSSGNFVWAINEGAQTIVINSISVDYSGNIYTTGFYHGSADFDPGTGTTYLSANGHCFVAKSDDSGNLVWVNTLNGSSSTSNDATGNVIALDASGGIYVSGSFIGTLDFDPGVGTDSIASSNANTVDGFILKLDNNGSLPISLLSFDVTKRTTDAELAWRTTSEINTAQFIIERSTDGKVFTSIGHVIAAGNSNALLYYRFIDKQAGILFPNQTVYYRFKQLDRDGKYTYSPVRTILFEKQGVDARVYPNPATWMVSLDVNPALVGSTYTIMNQTGRQVMEGKISALSTSIDMSKLPAGLYMILVGDGKEVLKVMIEQ